MKTAKWVLLMLTAVLLCALTAYAAAEEGATLTIERTEILVGETIVAHIDFGDLDSRYGVLYAVNPDGGENTFIADFEPDSDGKVTVETDTGAYQPGTMVYFVRIYNTGIDPEPETNRVEVTRTSKGYIGDAGSLSIAVSKECRTGEDLTFTVAGNEVMTDAYINVYDRDDNQLIWFDGPGTFTVPAEKLVRGKCRITASGRAVGYTGTIYKEDYFYYGDIDKTVHFSIDKTQVITLEKFFITASCPDADYIYVKRMDEGETYAHHDFSIHNTEGESVETFYTEPLKVKYFAAAVFGDEEVVSGPIEVTVTAPNGALPETVIDVKSMRLGDGDLTFAVGFPKEATGACFWYGSDDAYLYGYSEEGSQTVTIPAAELKAGEYYIIAEASAEGWAGTYKYVTFYVYGNTKDDGHTHVAYCNQPDACRLCGAPAGTVELTLEHEWDSNFQFNARYHWTTCTYGDEKLTAEHEFGEDGYCIYCGMEKAQGIRIDESTFPDAEFRKWVAENADRDGDGILSEAECSDVTGIDVSNRGITSLKGIEFFPELGTLNCADNSLTGLDLSGNRKLAALNCENNQIQALYLKDFLKLTLSYRGNTGIQVETAHGIITWIPGDADGNGKTDAQDVLEVLRSLNGQNASLHGINGDVNADGKTDIEDAMLILQYACGWDVTLK